MKNSSFLNQIWSIIPVFAKTDDSVFVGYTDNNKEKFRISVLNLYMGDMHYQLFCLIIKLNSKVTWKNLKLGEIVYFELQRRTYLSIMAAYPLSEKEYNRLRNNYSDHLKFVEKFKVKIEKEELLREIKRNYSRIEQSDKRTNLCIQFILAIIPIFGVIFNCLLDFNRLLGIITGLFGIYIIIVLIQLIYEVFKIRGYMSCEFKDLKGTKKKMQEQMLRIYIDWQQIKKKADYFVTLSYYMFLFTAVGSFYIFLLLVFNKFIGHLTN